MTEGVVTATSGVVRVVGRLKSYVQRLLQLRGEVVKIKNPVKIILKSIVLGEWK